MNFKQLQAAWHASITAPAGTPELDLVALKTHQIANRYQRQALLRRIYGSAAFTLAFAMLTSVTLLPGVIWPGMRVALTLWSASMLVCLTGIWYIRSGKHLRPDAPLMTHLKACQYQLQREIVYFRALRWTFWLPFGIGFAFAMAWGTPNAGGMSVFLILGTAVLWIWGFIYGPRHMLTELEAQADQLERMLREAQNNSDATGACK